MFSVFFKKMGEGKTGGASAVVKAESTGEDAKATGGLVSNFPHPRVDKTKQHHLVQTCLHYAYMRQPTSLSTFLEVETGAFE